MKSFIQLFLVATIAFAGAFAHADVQALKAQRITNLSLELQSTRAELSQMEASVNSGVTIEVATGKQVAVVSTAVAVTLGSIANSLEAGKSVQITALRAASMGLMIFGAGEGVIYGIDVVSLKNAISFKKQELARMTDQLESLQAQ